MIIKKSKKILRHKTKRRLFENFISLSVLQGANYILPLVTLPYLVRVLGTEKFGLISFAQAFIQYFNILTDYGFNLSATREISIHRENRDSVSEIFSSVMIIKFGLLIISFIILSIVIFIFKKFHQDWKLYYFTFGMVIGQVLFPVWFFQGMEKMKYITILNIVSKSIFTISIFIFVRNISDYIYVPILNSLGIILVGISSFFILFKKFKVKFRIVSIKKIKYQLIEGWYIFISTVAINLYTTSNTFILGLMTNNIIVGYFSAALKLVKAVQGLLAPISQTIYPYISKKVNESKEKGIIFIRKTTLFIGIISFSLSLILFIFSKPIVNIALGEKYQESIIVLKILSFLPFIVGLSNVFGIQTMLSFNFKKAFSNILIMAGIINIILALPLVYFYKHIGISISILISEIFVTVTMFLYLRKKGVNIMEGKVV